MAEEKVDDGTKNKKRFWETIKAKFFFININHPYIKIVNLV